MPRLEELPDAELINAPAVFFVQIVIIVWAAICISVVGFAFGIAFRAVIVVAVFVVIIVSTRLRCAS